MSASATPFADRVVSWGIFTSTVSPLGVLAVFLSGATLRLGLNGNELQPTNGACSKLTGASSGAPGFHDCASTEDTSGFEQ